ncbi:HWE histidine kinase domain-containing protein [Rhizobium mesoamericanum]|uniref:histidine kinase n=1 Tax=Rhizobium mesoamericanum STM3625 TaxID=1211777 RepID=K0Q1K1_9HYPH|nr:hypothetical protein BN77_p10085 [Rhizobium mesoamericanum STM3625]
MASIAKRNLETASSLELFGKVFLGRLKSMETAYAMLSSNNWKSASVRDIFADELEPSVIRITIWKDRTFNRRRNHVCPSQWSHMTSGQTPSNTASCQWTAVG